MKGVATVTYSSLFFLSAGVAEEVNPSPALSEGPVLRGEWQTHLVRHRLRDSPTFEGRNPLLGLFPSLGLNQQGVRPV